MQAHISIYTHIMKPTMHIYTFLSWSYYLIQTLWIHTTHARRISTKCKLHLFVSHEKINYTHVPIVDKASGSGLASLHGSRNEEPYFLTSFFPPLR